MYQNTWTRLPNIVILAGQTVSGPADIRDIYDATAIVLQSPAALDAGTYTIETSIDYSPSRIASAVNAEPNVTPGTWATLLYPQSGGAIPVPAANQSRVYTDLPAAGSFRIRCSVAAAADRTFQAAKLVSGGS